jgi:DNA-binding MarR family transcriptional regulator
MAEGGMTKDATRAKFELSDYLPYLLNRAGARIAQSFEAMTRERHGITLPMWRVLAVLRVTDGLRVGQLAERTTIEVSTLSRLLGAMEKLGLVERRRPPMRSESEDARTVTIHVTPEGRAMTARIIPEAERYQTIALDGFAPEEARVLKAMLLRLFANLDRLEADGTDPDRLAS